MKDQYMMALDAGSGVSRCVLVNLENRNVISAYEEWGYTTPPGLGIMAVEFDPSQFWKILSEVSRQAITKAGIQPEQAVAVSSAKKGGYLDNVKTLGILEPVSERSLGPEKVRLYTSLHLERSLCNSLLLCMFVANPTAPMRINKLTEVTRAVTGWDLSEWEMLKVGERGVTLARLFNIMHGLRLTDDRLPSSIMEPIREGNKAGWVVNPMELKIAIDTYYGMMGGDEDGIPTKTKLAEFGFVNLAL